MIGVLSDLHLKEKLAYADYIKDGRKAEKEEILDFIVESFEDCNIIVFVGDQLDRRNNPSEVVREFVELVERFKDKQIVIIAGNHEKTGNGKSAMDFLKEIDGKNNWHIVTNNLYKLINSKKSLELHFLPYFTNSELGVKSSDEAKEKVLDMLTGGNILFVHHSISEILINENHTTDSLSEVVLPRELLEERYKLVVGGHIHKAQKNNRTIISGSIFNNEVGETQKYIWKIDEKDCSTKKIKLPGRGIYKLENPSIEDLDAIHKGNIVKVVLTDEKKKKDVNALKDALKRFDAYLFLEQYPRKRKKMHFEEGMLEFDVEKLLETYAKERKIDVVELKKAWALIK